MYNITLRCVRATIVVVEKQGVLHNLCVSVALGTQHAMRMRHIVMLWPASLYNILPHFLKRHDFREKVTEHKMCVLIFSTSFV